MGCGLLAVQASAFALYWWPAPKVLWGDEIAYLDAARRLLATGSTGLDLLWPPLYPHVLAGLLQVAGGSLILVQLVQAGLLFGDRVAPGRLDS